MSWGISHVNLPITNSVSEAGISSLFTYVCLMAIESIGEAWKCLHLYLCTAKTDLCLGVIDLEISPMIRPTNP